MCVMICQCHNGSNQECIPIYVRYWLCSVRWLFRTRWIYIYTVGQTRPWISLSPGKEEQLRFTCLRVYPIWSRSPRRTDIKQSHSVFDDFLNNNRIIFLRRGVYFITYTSFWSSSHSSWRIYAQRNAWSWVLYICIALNSKQLFPR